MVGRSVGLEDRAHHTEGRCAEIEERVARTHAAWAQWRTTDLGTRSALLERIAEAFESARANGRRGRMTPVPIGR